LVRFLLIKQKGGVETVKQGTRKSVIMTALVAALVGAMTGAAAGVASAQTPPAQTQIESGQFGRALESLAPIVADPGADQRDHFLAIQAAMRLDQPERAAGSVEALVASPSPDWQAVGESVRAMNGGDAAGAVASAERAVAANAYLFAAQYQLGLARARVEDWAGAALAFERAVELDPSFAYATYYAGLAYSKVNRADRTAVYFERFLKMAPNAPERAAVQSIMRTLRGR
jgi:tetratricopeptide (TPR) repeat protein